MARIIRPLAGPIVVGIASLLCAFFAFGGPTFAADAAAPTLDHFRCYTLTPLIPATPDVVVGLQDQFDTATTGFQFFRVLQSMRLCNPVEKRHGDSVTPITNPDGHLKMHLIRPVVAAGTAALPPDPARLVVVRNQFGFQFLKVGQPEALAVPTQKLPYNPPQGLDHFKCYRASGRSINQVVGLNDQFLQSPEVNVYQPYEFCNPVAKLHNDRPTPIENPKAHLVCYTTSREPFVTQVDTLNQFGTEPLLVNEPDLLCVPSTKLGFRVLK